MIEHYGSDAVATPPAPAAMIANAFLTISGLSYVAAGQPILNNVSLAIAEGEFFTLLGPSGCGKTTLLRLLAGFADPGAGTLSMDGADIARLPAAQRPINTVFQNYALFPHLSVAQNVGFGLKMQGRDRGEIGRRVAQMLELVRLDGMGDRPVSALSGGQQQRVALARAIAPAPRLLLLDEPLSALDHQLRRAMQDELKRIQKSVGTTFLFVTHDQEEALSLSDRIAVLNAGRLEQCSTPDRLYHYPASRFVASFVGQANFLEARLRLLERGRATVELGGDLVSLALPDTPIGPGPVTVMIRPEEVLIGAHEGIRRPASLERRSFFGNDACFHFRLDNGNELIARVRGHEDRQGMAPGERTMVTLPLQSLRLVAAP